MKTFYFEGRTYEYNEDTIFYLEIGRYDNAYAIEKTYTHQENNQYQQPCRAIDDYKKYQVLYGYKKRLSMSQDGKKTILAKEISQR